MTRFINDTKVFIGLILSRNKRRRRRETAEHWQRAADTFYEEAQLLPDDSQKRKDYMLAWQIYDAHADQMRDLQ